MIFDFFKGKKKEAEKEKTVENISTTPPAEPKVTEEGIKITQSVEPKVTEEMILDIEQYWRVNMPEDYKAFLLEHNGGIPDKAAFNYTIGSDTCHDVIDRFLCLLDDPSDHPLGDYDIDVVESRFSERLTENEDLIGCEMPPIAALAYGDYICLDYRKDKQNPCICVWIQEESGDFSPVTYKVADSFTEFLNKLY